MTSALGYWQGNLTKLKADPDIKETTKCIPPSNATERVCFDQIGVPVMPFTILGKQRCVEEKENDCSACGLMASALQTTFLLNNNAFQEDSASAWEKYVLIRNLKTLNKVLGTYNTDLPENVTYNEPLLNILTEVYNNYTKSGFKWVPFKADFLAERSIPDNIELEAS